MMEFKAQIEGRTKRLEGYIKDKALQIAALRGIEYPRKKNGGEYYHFKQNFKNCTFIYDEFYQGYNLRVSYTDHTGRWEYAEVSCYKCLEKSEIELYEKRPGEITKNHAFLKPTYHYTPDEMKDVIAEKIVKLTETSAEHTGEIKEWEKIYDDLKAPVAQLHECFNKIDVSGFFKYRTRNALIDAIGNWKD